MRDEGHCRYGTHMMQDTDAFACCSAFGWCRCLGRRDPAGFCVRRIVAAVVAANSAPLAVVMAQGSGIDADGKAGSGVDGCHCTVAYCPTRSAPGINCSVACAGENDRGTLSNARTAAIAPADQHFAPTERAAEMLRRENVPDDRVHVTGNTVRRRGLLFDIIWRCPAVRLRQCDF